MIQEFRFTNIDETRNCFLKKIEWTELMSRKHKKVCITVNYIEQLPILASTTTGCISTSVFASLLNIPIGIASSAIGLKFCAVAAGIKKYQSIIKKKRKKHYKEVLLAKSKLNNIEVLNCRALIDSNIGHDEFVLIKNVLKRIWRYERRNPKL